MGPYQQGVSLQGVLAQQWPASEKPILPHHPITCVGPLRFTDRLACDHAETPADDPRLRCALIHSVALLLVEIAAETL